MRVLNKRPPRPFFSEGTPQGCCSITARRGPVNGAQVQTGNDQTDRPVSPGGGRRGRALRNHRPVVVQRLSRAEKLRRSELDGMAMLLFIVRANPGRGQRIL